MGRPRAWRWTITTTSPDAEQWASALRTRGVVVDLRASWPNASDTDVVVCVGDAPARDVEEQPIVIDLPQVFVTGASPEVVAEYLFSRARAALSESALAEYRRDQHQITERVTHDLKNSISVVQANFAFLRGVVPSEPDLDDAIDDAHEAARHMDRALSDLHLMTSLELGIEPVARDVVGLTTVLEAARATWARRLEARKLVLDSRLPIDLSAVGQASMLRTVFDNVIGTRVRCARNGKIEVRGWTEGANVVVCIADHGLCAAPEDRQRVFDKAGMGLLRAREIGSLGVALYLVRLIVEAHGGEVSLVDLDPFTSCFRLVLPGVLRSSISPIDSR